MYYKWIKNADVETNTIFNKVNSWNDITGQELNNHTAKCTSDKYCIIHIKYLSPAQT